MKIILILAAFVVLCHTKQQGVGLGKGEEVTVRLRSVNAPSALPQRLTLNLEHKRRDVELPTSLDLSKNENIDNINFYVDDDRVDANFENAAFYQDLTNHAVITAKVMMKAGKPIRVVRGSFIANDVSYEIEPTPFEDNEKTPENEATKIRDDQIYKQLSLLSLDNDQKQPPVHTEAPTTSDAEFEDHDHLVRQVSDATQHIDKRAPKLEDFTAINATKRGTNQYDIEMYWVTDYELYRDWKSIDGHNLQNLKEFFAHQANGLDIVYKSFKDIGLTVNVWVQKVEITTKKSTKMPSDMSKIPGKTNRRNRNKKSIDASSALKKMMVMRTKRGYTHYLPDHLQLWTGWDIDGSVLGLAPYRAICLDRSGNSIIESVGWHSWAVAAHELGHNIGMHHDGENGCSVKGGNIMTPSLVWPTAANRKQIYKFSKCSLKQCKDVLEGKNKLGFKRNCLKTASCQVEFKTKHKLPGNIDNLNKMCQIEFGEDAIISQKCGSDPPSPKTCLILKCRQGTTCHWGRAEDGSPCGKNMHCIQNECVAKSVQPPHVNKACKKGGGNPRVPEGCTDKSKMCPIVQRIPSNCADHARLRERCCKTCTLYGYSP